jgi:hypothetical protein
MSRVNSIAVPPLSRPQSARITARNPILNLTNAKNHQSAQNSPSKIEPLPVVICANPFLSEPSANLRSPRLKLPSSGLLPHYFLTSLPRSFIPMAKRDPLFSIVYALFAIHNVAHPLYFLITANSLAKRPGVGGHSLFNSRDLSQCDCEVWASFPPPNVPHGTRTSHALPRPAEWMTNRDICPRRRSHSGARRAEIRTGGYPSRRRKYPRR